MCAQGPMRRKPATPLPLAPLLVVAWVILSEALTLTITLPFVPFMVQDFFGFEASDPRVGFYSGIILGTAFFAEFVGSYPWGWVADRIGRRPVIVYGLAISTLTIPLFGFSTSFEMAIAARASRGLLNGVAGTTKTFLAEITDSTNRTRAFSMITTAFGTGMLVGPLLGGFLSHPATSLPFLFGHVELFRRFPYALPTLVCGAASAAATVVAVFAINETLLHKRPLLPPILQCRRRKATASPALLEAPPPQVVVDVSVEPAAPEPRSAPGLGCLAWQSAALYGAIAFFTVMQQEMLPLWAKLPRSEGGLFWGANSIGLVLAVGGVGILTGAMLIFPLGESRIGMVHTFRIAQVIACVAAAAIPYFNALQPDVSSPTLVALLSALIFLSFASLSTMFSATMLFITNSVEPAALGRANGLGQSFASMARAVGPVCAGPLVASLAGKGKPPLGVHAAFLITALLGCLSLAVSFMMPGIERPRLSIVHVEPLHASAIPEADERIAASPTSSSCSSTGTSHAPTTR